MNRSLGIFFEFVGQIVFRHKKFRRQFIQWWCVDKIFIQIKYHLTDNITLLIFSPICIQKLFSKLMKNQHNTAFRDIFRQSFFWNIILKSLVNQCPQIILFLNITGNKVRMLFFCKPFYFVNKASYTIMIPEIWIQYPQHITFVGQIIFNNRSVQFARRDYQYIPFFNS